MSEYEMTDSNKGEDAVSYTHLDVYKRQELIKNHRGIKSLIKIKVHVKQMLQGVMNHQNQFKS